MGTYVHHVPGRLRVKLPALGRDPRLSGTVREAVEAIEGVTTATVNLRSRSLIVRYDSRSVTAEAVLDCLKTAGFLSFARPQPSGSGIVHIVGAAAGHAIFGAFLKTGFEKSLSGLVTSAMR